MDLPRVHFFYMILVVAIAVAAVFYNPFVVLHEFYHHIRTKEVYTGDLRRTLTCMQKVSLKNTIG
jgi:uncharacterized membrane protein YhaH (DUF805 family)